MPKETQPMTTEADLFDRLRAVVLAAGRLDAGTRLQLVLMLERALERATDSHQEDR